MDHPLIVSCPKQKFLPFFSINMLLLTTAAAAAAVAGAVRVAEKTHLKKDPELSFDLMLRGSKHFYFILGKTTNE